MRNRTGAPPHRPETAAAGHRGPIGNVRLDSERGIQHREYALEDRSSAGDEGLTSDGSRNGLSLRRDARLRGRVARSQVFLESDGDDALDGDWRKLEGPHVLRFRFTTALRANRAGARCPTAEGRG